MAKDNTQVAAAQYKVLLKPTDVGLLVMKRMERPHLDKSAELRRLIELGYAAEQAGFILDGTVLRHAGRAWDTQPDLIVERNGDLAGTLPQEKPAQPQLDRAEPQNTVEFSSQPVADQAPTGSERGQSKSELQSNLRSLSV